MIKFFLQSYKPCFGQILQKIVKLVNVFLGAQLLWTRDAVAIGGAAGLAGLFQIDQEAVDVGHDSNSFELHLFV